MRVRFRSTAAALAAGALTATSGQAQTYFSGMTNGCFTTAAACAPVASSSYQVGVGTAGGLLTFSNAVFSGTSTGGSLSFGGTPVAGALNTNNFGAFTLGTLASGSHTFNGTNFGLLVSFTSPNGTTPTTIIAPVTGTLTTSGSNVLVDFGNNGFGAAYTTTVNAGGGSFLLTVADVTLSPGSTNDIKAQVSGLQGTLIDVNAVPEPATNVLMASGLFGLAGLAARRRARAKR